MLKFNSSRLILAVLILCACGQSPDGPVGQEGTGGYRAHLVFPQEAYVGGRTAKGLTDIDCAGQGIDTIEFNFICKGQGYGPHRFACAAGGASIPGVPAGKGVVVEVFADDAAGTALYEGSEVVDIVKNQVTKGGEVAMTPVEFPSTDNETDTNTSTNTDTDRDLTVDETVGVSINIRELGMEFVWIEPGSFNMGSREPESNDFERPQHRVTFVEGYYMQTTEVTQWQYEAIMGEHFFEFSDCGERCPAENVSWNDAQDFIAALNVRVSGGYEFRLPTEAEWEYAARAGHPTAYGFGDTLTRGQANFGSHGPIPVGRLAFNDWGLYDMHGNVWEWVEDDWHDNYQGALTNGIAWIDEPIRGASRVLRGGSWHSQSVYCRSAFRSRLTPDSRGYGDGFRLASSLASR